MIVHGFSPFLRTATPERDDAPALWRSGQMMFTQFAVFTDWEYGFPDKSTCDGNGEIRRQIYDFHHLFIVLGAVLKGGKRCRVGNKPSAFGKRSERERQQRPKDVLR
ncbi:MAG: hypothetical protein ABF665_10795 [Gluconacetobacter sp.]